MVLVQLPFFSRPSDSYCCLFYFELIQLSDISTASKPCLSNLLNPFSDLGKFFKEGLLRKTRAQKKTSMEKWNIYRTLKNDRLLSFLKFSVAITFRSIAFQQSQCSRKSTARCLRMISGNIYTVFANDQERTFSIF